MRQETFISALGMHFKAAFKLGWMMCRVNENNRKLFAFVGKKFDIARTDMNRYNKIMRTISTYYRIPIADIRSRSRKQEIVRARHVCAYFGKMKTGLTLRELGAGICRKHETVLFANKAIQNEIDTNKDFKEEIRQIGARL